MKALVCRQYGAPELLRVEDVPTPTPGAGEALIEVEAAGVSFVDTLIINNQHQVKHELPFSPGREVAGRVKATGSGTSEFKVGERVAAILDKGGHAQFALAPAAETFSCPADCDMTAAGGHMSVYLTAWLALQERAALAPEQKVLVLGAGGGTGLAAVDIASQLGAEVIAAASTSAKLALAKARGAVHLINYTEVALDEATKKILPNGVDLVFDPVGGDLFEPASRCVGWNGSYLIIGFAGGGAPPQFAANRLLVKNRAALGFVLMYYRRVRPDLLQNAATHILNGFSNGTLHPDTSSTGSLAQAPQMLRAIIDRTMVGKGVVLPS
ncbi:MAG: NADPH:quinone oxidoreductase family protein [Pseudomonadales bacterium]